MRGLELLDTGAVGVVLDSSGAVIARAEAHTGDVVKAALDVVEQLGADSSGTIAFAASTPESRGAVAAVEAIAARFGGNRPRAPIPAGTAAAAAEAWVGAGQGVGDLVFFAAADQVTAGLLRNGSPRSGAHGYAPAVAWLSLNPVEREDYRKIGCLQAEVGAVGIVRRLIWRIKAGDESRVRDHVSGDLSAITLDHVLTAAREGDGVAVSVIRDTAKYLGMAAANLAAIVDPEMLLLGGIMATTDLLFDPVCQEVVRRLPAPMGQNLKIARARLGPYGPAIGAARLASVER
jgi:predicted NBD/HSP70 family sugar kinase